jgi:hypothetical protein
MCKLRAFAELLDGLLAERYGIADPALRRFRYGVQVNSLGLTEAQPENNVARIVIEMLAVTLSKRTRARAVQLPAGNEALGLPRPWDPQWSLRLQQGARLRNRLARVRRSVPRICRGRGAGPASHAGAREEMDRGKPGLNGHSNGAEQVAVRARDCGFEVVYQGIRLTPAEIVAAAVAEDVHGVGLSILSGSHLELVPEILDGLRSAGAADIPGRRRAGSSRLPTRRRYEGCRPSPGELVHHRACRPSDVHAGVVNVVIPRRVSAQRPGVGRMPRS